MNNESTAMTPDVPIMKVFGGVEFVSKFAHDVIYNKLKKENEINREINRNLANANADYKQENKKLKELLNKDDIHLLHNYFRGVLSCDNEDTLQRKEDYELYQITHKLNNYSAGKTVRGNE